MDKNTITGLILMGLLLIGFSWWSQPSAEEQAEIIRQDSITTVTRQKLEASRKAAEQKHLDALKKKQLKDTTALFYKALQGQQKDIVLKNDKLELTLNTKGGTVTKAVIKNFKDKDEHDDVTLFDEQQQRLNFILSAKDVNIATQDLFFLPSAQTDSSVVLTALAEQGKFLVLSYTLGQDYLLHMSLRVEGMSGQFAPDMHYMSVNWQDKCRQQEKGFTFENRYAALTYHKTKGGTDYLSETSEKIDEQIEDKIDWIAFKNQFFSAVIIAKNDFDANATLTSIPQQKGSGYLKSYEANLKTFFDPTGIKSSEFEFFFGPNDFRLLQHIEKQSQFNKDLELQKLVYLGWPLFRIINRWFTIYVFDWLSRWFPMGVVLILITLLLKVITFPMVKKSYMSSAKMRVLKPKLDAATAQYNKPEDQMQKQQAMMSEYAKYGVSPLSGCLPMLIQMPIWIAMFNFVPNAIQLRGESFLWIKDLSSYDPILEWDKNIWLIGDHLSLTCILFCIANVLYSWMTMRQQRDQMVGQQAEQMKMMQWIMYLMPIMFFFMFNDYSSGLNFYYFISLFFSAAIMWTLRKTTNDEKLLQILETYYKENKANPQKLSGLAARLQAMQQQQQEIQRKRAELDRKKNK